MESVLLDAASTVRRRGRRRTDAPRRGRCCPIGEALVARNGADIVTPQHQRSHVVGADLVGAFRGEQPPRGRVLRGPVSGIAAVSSGRTTPLSAAH
jgi:hypothetical protein